MKTLTEISAAIAGLNAVINSREEIALATTNSMEAALKAQVLDEARNEAFSFVEVLECLIKVNDDPETTNSFEDLLRKLT